MFTDAERRKIIDSLECMSDAEHDEIMESLVQKGIMDREGNVLVRMPEAPPAWLTQSNGHVVEPKAKSKKSRKRS